MAFTCGKMLLSVAVGPPAWPTQRVAVGALVGSERAPGRATGPRLCSTLWHTHTLQLWIVTTGDTATGECAGSASES